MFDPGTSSSGQFPDMSTILCSELWPGIRIQPRLVSRQDTIEAGPQNKAPKPLLTSLRPVDIPLDIYLVILENSSRDTLRKFCLVSRLSYHYATPLLWKNVNLPPEEMRATQWSNALRDIIKRQGKHVETIEFSMSWEERSEELSWERPIEAVTNTLASDMRLRINLVELALEQMPKLWSFTWDSNQTPSNEMIDALKTRPYLEKLILDSNYWNVSLIPDLNFCGFRHLTSFEMENIVDDSQVLAIRNVLDSSLALKKLRFGFVEYFWDEETDNGIDIFDVLFSVNNPQNPKAQIPGKSLEELTILHGLFDEHGFKPSFFQATGLCFKNLDSLTLHQFNVHETPALDESCNLRLRKLRLQCSEWEPLRALLQTSTKLELLHIQMTSVGFKYDDLISLVCRSGDTLKDLRLEWDNVRKQDVQETMSKDAAWTLASKCDKLRELSLRADFDLDTWCNIEATFPALFVDLTHFKLQRVVPKEKPSQQQVELSASTSAKTPKDSVKQQLSIDFLTGTKNGIKYPETTAGDFFAVFITAAKNAAISGDDKFTKLKYVGIDGHVYELHVWDGMFTFSEVPKEKVRLCGGPFDPNIRIGPQDVFQLSSLD